MIRKNLKKGTLGYINKYKKLYGLVSLGWFLVIAAIFVTGLIVYKGDKMNMFTATAVILVLPAARLWVTWIIMLPYRSVDSSKYEHIHQLMKDKKCKVYADLVVTREEGAMYLPIVVNYDNNLFTFAPEQKKSTADIRTYLNQMIKAAGSGSKAQVFEAYDKYERCINHLGESVDLNGKDADAIEKQLFSAAL